MSLSSIIILVTIFAYMAMMLGIGFAVSEKNKTTSDFYLGGRKLGPFVTAMSAEASDMSGWLLMGLPAVAMMGGLAEASWTAIGLAIGTYINWLLVARKLRLYSAKIDAFTLPDFFAKRFGDKSHVITLISAIMIIVFFVPYVASGFAACGKLFASLFGMDYMLAMIISAVVIIVYCTLGGFLAASTTDFIQSIIMTIALLVVLGFTEGIVGGFGNVFDNVKGLNGFLDLFKGFNVATGETGSYGALPVASTLAWGLGYFGMPHILLRFMAIEDDKKLKTSRRVASIWVVISMGVAVLIGVVGYSLMQKGILPAYESASAGETIIVDIAKYLSGFGFIPAFTGGIILSGILASTMSTADSQLLAAASSISQDLIHDTFRIKLSAKKSMILARVSVIVISIIAIFIASDPDSSVFRVVSFAWAGFGAVFGPAMLCSLFWKRATKGGIIAGMVGGGVMVFVWKFVIAKLGGVFAIYELLPAFILSLVLIIVVSLITKAPAKEITDTFDELKADMKK
ncbi:MAG: sodium/proline symporter [Clostridia bacterium]|nr:sodium/proline symporter [Clostridia bacterium]MBQ4561926.1 sodium/proline symporter [Clostridia bacterium]